MILISHRGNIDGPNPAEENHPDYIQKALNLGFDVEVDVWYENRKWWLGHDEPQYKTTLLWLRKKTNKLWIHAKNIEAAYQLYAAPDFKHKHYFFHDTDDITLTSKNFLWTYPGKRPLTPGSIAVMPEHTDWTKEELKSCAGICSDYIRKFEVSNG